MNPNPNPNPNSNLNHNPNPNQAPPQPMSSLLVLPGLQEPGEFRKLLRSLQLGLAALDLEQRVSLSAVHPANTYLTLALSLTLTLTLPLTLTLTPGPPRGHLRLREHARRLARVAAGPHP